MQAKRQRIITQASMDHGSMARHDRLVYEDLYPATPKVIEPGNEAQDAIIVRASDGPHQSRHDTMHTMRDTNELVATGERMSETFVIRSSCAVEGLLYDRKVSK